MAVKHKALVTLFLLISVLSLSTLFTLSHADEDPQLRKCLEDCSLRRQEKKKCTRDCYQKHAEREREKGGGRDNPWREEEEEQEEGRGGKRGWQKENPYVFQSEQFKHQIRTEHGHVKVLKNFAKQSWLLLGIANYRVAIMELNPRTFVVPNHWDADSVGYVVRGRGIVTVLKKDDKESYHIKQGDVLKVDAGSVVYVINSDSREKLTIAKLVQPVSIPGKFVSFFGAGGENPESFYRAFSDEILEAAFNTQRDKIERIFGKQRSGAIIRASEEQIRALSRDASEGGKWPWGEKGPFSESKGPYNLLRKRPTHSNQHGQLYEADKDDYRQLGDLDVRVSVANITSGSMMAPWYNSRSTKIAVVVEGRGQLEIVCPHLGRQSERETRRGRKYEEEEEEEEKEQGQQQGQRYRKVQANLSPGTVFVVPAGHPTVEIASRGEDLQIACFETRAENNERIFLAGRNNILSKMEREAKELAFDTSAREVDELLNAQRDEAFISGPGSRSRHGGGGRGGRDFTVESILEVVAGM
ncbi:hypothetical protein LUZ60_001499 [Juncus effusus]|nr:hypothetical protein LUZ60_001499 [Juncus effusus]